MLPRPCTVGTGKSRIIAIEDSDRSRASKTFCDDHGLPVHDQGENKRYSSFVESILYRSYKHIDVDDDARATWAQSVYV